MYVLFWKEPTAIHSGKSGYVMSWRGKQVAICAEEKPLQDWIGRQDKSQQDKFYIEEFPN